MSSSEASVSDTAGTAQIGVTGLAVMGRNLARNFARHGHTTTAQLDRTVNRAQPSGGRSRTVGRRGSRRLSR